MEKKMTVKEAFSKFGEGLLGKTIKIEAVVVRVFPENIWVNVLETQGLIINIEGNKNIEII